MVPTPTLSKVLTQALALSAHSWEYGTTFQAYLEHTAPSYSIWKKPFQSPPLPLSNPALNYIKPFIRTNSTTLVDGAGSSGDPAALGIPALLLTGAYAEAADRQAKHLLERVPRWSNGAISHREDVPELWADSVYMVPPFLAYYAVVKGDLKIAKEAAKQCVLYDEVLRDNQKQGVWRHIIGPQSQDPGLWSTGNAWGIAGVSRVLATLRASKWDAETKGEQRALVALIKKVVDGVLRLDTDRSGLLRNYLDDSSWFGEVSGTALIAATVLRMAVLEPQVFAEKRYTDWAVKKKEEIDRRINDKTGIVAPAVNPLGWHDRNEFLTGSPEGQAFVVLLYAAWRDWKN